ncbi:hypothetical protein NHF40_13360 [Maricaulaceae bacterium EIL42A08]|nr:hypothetical protein [Maricaulaceae bacterium EIL42A08]
MAVASAILLSGGCGQAQTDLSAVDIDYICEITDADLGGFALRDPSREEGREAILACLIAHADAVLDQRPADYGEAHMRWHAYAVLDGRQPAQTLSVPAARLSQSEVAEAAAWIDQFHGVGTGATLDAYGCRVVPEEVMPAFLQAKPDTVSQLCDQLRQQAPASDDRRALHQIAHFEGCPEVDAPGRPELKMLPARLAAQVDGNRIAFSCLLDNARRPLSSTYIPVGDPLIVLAAGHSAGMLEAGEWADVIRRVDDEAIIADALDTAAQVYGAVIRANGE